MKKPALRVGFSNRNSSSNHVLRSFKEPRAAVTNCQRLRRLLSSHSMEAARDVYACRPIYSLGWHIASSATVYGRLVTSQIFAATHCGRQNQPAGSQTFH